MSIGMKIYKINSMKQNIKKTLLKNYLNFVISDALIVISCFLIEGFLIEGFLKDSLVIIIIKIFSGVIYSKINKSQKLPEKYAIYLAVITALPIIIMAMLLTYVL